MNYEKLQARLNHDRSMNYKSLSDMTIVDSIDLLRRAIADAEQRIAELEEEVHRRCDARGIDRLEGALKTAKPRTIMAVADDVVEVLLKSVPASSIARRPIHIVELCEPSLL